MQGDIRVMATQTCFFQVVQRCVLFYLLSLMSHGLKAYFFLCTKISHFVMHDSLLNDTANNALSYTNPLWPLLALK